MRWSAVVKPWMRVKFHGLLLLGAGLLVACDDPPEVPLCSLAADDPSVEALETKCDGLDNDCDGLTDILLPVAANACTTTAKGACGQGFAACQAGQRVCITPPALAEARNSVDDDCNGVVDDLNDVTLATARVRIMVAQNIFQDVSGTTLLELTEPAQAAAEALSQSGIEFKGIDFADPLHTSDWAYAMGDLKNFNIALIAGYFDASFFTNLDEWPQLVAWVANGGTLIWLKPLPPSGEGDPYDVVGQQMYSLAGLARTGSKKRRDIDEIAINGDLAASVYLDSAAERQISLRSFASPALPEVWVYQPDLTSGVQVLGAARKNGKEVGATWLRRQHGKGAVYTLGWDPFSEVPMGCYINCAAPGRDLAVMLLRGIAREAAHGHPVWKHTVPGVQSTVLAMTHDLDAPDAVNASSFWGDPGALQSARIENAHNVHGTYFVTTDYYTGYFNPEIIGQLCDLGMCPEGAHSVRHGYLSDMPFGDCSVKQSNYDAANPTICGEIVVSMEILNGLLPAKMPIRAWRTPLLSTPHGLFAELPKHNVFYDSSFAMGDIGGNFPIYTQNSQDLRDIGGIGPIWTFPIVQEDGIGDVLADGTLSRLELRTSNRNEFLGHWTWALLENQRNHSWNTLLLHPSYGVGTSAANLKVKLDVMDAFLSRVVGADAQAAGFDVLVDDLVALGDFWRGRAGTSVRATFTPGQGYSGTIAVGNVEVPHFSLEFGDTIKTFDCPGGGSVTIRGNRVVFDKTLSAGFTCSFVGGIL